eukprot:COSAG01_NODE_19596_length_1001_cov_1.557650_1_plen_100_part_10
MPYVDLYNETADTDWFGASGGPLRSGPGYGYNGSCPQQPESGPRRSGPGSCGMLGPEEEYEEFKFKTRVLEIIENHDVATPLFLCYTSHTVHVPLQAPNT